MIGGVAVIADAELSKQKVTWMRFSSRGLQIAILICSFVPLSAGLAGMLLGPSMVDHTEAGSVSLDSHFRYLSGLLFGIGLAFVSLIKKIEVRTFEFRLLSFLVVMGGLGRLYSYVRLGEPDRSMLFGLAMELLIVPLLVLWQSTLTQRNRGQS